MESYLLSSFENEYGRPPTLHVRCPGRVNLIGEHIDYHGYGVFPMAIEQATHMVAATNDMNLIRIRNIDNDKYQSHSLTLPSNWMGAAPPKWFDYFLCGWKGIMDKLRVEQKGFDVLVTGDVPESSGLSSSSSVVCAAALCVWALHTGKAFEDISREELAELCASAEQFVGTQGGGMDQAAEVLSTAGSALRIDFSPLRSKHIALPKNAQFLVLHCGEKLNKAATNQFNQRVVEGRLAAKLLLKLCEKSCDSLRLKDVQETCNKTLREMKILCEQLPETVTREELEKELGKEQVNVCLSENTKHLTSFVIRSRARHVYGEALRVEEFEKACDSGNVETMGQLMNDSHYSCSKDYECSCSSLDTLVDSSVKGGALGARLTGAGWGGCVVALTDTDAPADLSHLNLLFKTSPSAGIDVKFL